MSAGVRARALAAAVAAAALLGAAPPAPAAELVEIATPSRHVDPATAVFNGERPSELRAVVLLPDGYDGRRRFPILYLLHGIGDTHRTWSSDSGRIQEVAGGLGAIVVMPEAGRGFYANWWNGGRRADPGWERFHLDELIPLVERRFRILPGRSNRAVAGLSMGGLGSTYLGSQRPGYFGAVASFSGLVQHQRPEVQAALEATGDDYERVFGPMSAPYATGHNPARLVENLRHTRLYVAVGDGTARPGVPSSPAAVAGGGAFEAGLRVQNDEFVAAARGAGLDVTYRPQQGVHDWPYWREHLRDAIRWGLFEPVPEDPARWTYRTVAQTGVAWGLRYELAEPPGDLVVLAREGALLRGEGTGTIAVRGARGCGFTQALPFERPIADTRCPRLRVSLGPRRLRVGERALLRVRVTRAGASGGPVRGASVRLGRARARTDRAGRARLAVRPGGVPGLRRLRVSARGHEPATARLRVLRAAGRTR